jgi:hypothetical protein
MPDRRLAALSLAGSIALLSTPVAAQGLEFLHAQRVEGRKVCFTEHIHYGSSTAQANRKAAEANAVGSWADFTILEYGGAWGSWRLAASKGMKCGSSGGGWSCSVEARPCRPLTASDPRPGRR